MPGSARADGGLAGAARTKGRGLGASEADAGAMLKEERAATLTQFLVTGLVLQGGEEADGLGAKSLRCTVLLCITKEVNLTHPATLHEYNYCLTAHNTKRNPVFNTKRKPIFPATLHHYIYCFQGTMLAYGPPADTGEHIVPR